LDCTDLPAIAIEQENEPDDALGNIEKVALKVDT